jgi:hypothetical protein
MGARHLRARPKHCVLHAKRVRVIQYIFVTEQSLFHLCISQQSLVIRILLLYKIQSKIMSGKRDKTLFYDDDEDKKCPPNHPVSWSDQNEVGMKNDASLFFEEEKEEVKAGDPPDGRHVNESLARNEAWGTAHDLDTKERIDIEDPGKSGGNNDMVSHLRGPDESPGAEAVESQARPPNVTSQRRSRAALAPIRPGAQRVDGPGNNGLEDDSFTVIIGGDEEVTIDPIPPTLSAQLVNTKEEENRAVQNFLQNAVVAEVVPEVSPDNRGMWWKLAGAFLVMMSIVIGVALGISLRKEPTPAPTNSPTSGPTLSPEALLSDLLSPISSDKGEALLTNLTPQNKAFNWMVTNNTRLGTLSDERIIQRYALATLYYSANGESWNSHEFWLSDNEECNIWNTTYGPLTCTENDTLTQVDLRENNLNRTIPPEIGLLTSLGECVTPD